MGSPGASDTTEQAVAKVIEVVAPASGAAVGEVPVMGADRVCSAVEAAREAQREWARETVESRAASLLKFRDALVARAEPLVELIVRETGKPRHEALLHEVAQTADLATFYTRVGSRVLAPREIALRLFRHRKSYVHWVPRGVVGVIGSWSLPLAGPMAGVIPALLAGSTVVIKPSEATPLSALEAKRIWDRAGLPDGVLSVVTGGAETGRALIEAGPELVHFTGRADTGREVAVSCARRSIPSILALRGKAPLIACADASLEWTARSAVFGAFANAGQTCLSVERMYVHRELHDALVERIVELTSELEQGDPETGWVDVGAITIPERMARIEEIVADAVAKGAVVRTGGRRLEGKGRFYRPTVLTGCDHTMRVMREEVFGPVLPIMKVDSEEQAVELANDSEAGLEAYVFSADRERGRRVAERIRAGNVLVNDVLSNYASPEAPFCGVGGSGFGQVHGEEVLRQMSELRHVSYDRMTIARNAFGYPYSGDRFRWLLRGVRTLFSGGDVLQKISELL